MRFINPFEKASSNVPLSITSLKASRIFSNVKLHYLKKKKGGKPFTFVQLALASAHKASNTSFADKGANACTHMTPLIYPAKDVLESFVCSKGLH